MAEAWRKRRYQAAFICKLNDVEAEAAETQSWLEFAVARSYLSAKAGGEWQQAYDKIISTLVSMIQHSDSRVIPSGQRESR